MKDYDNFFLPASDLERGKRFYGDVLGLKAKFDFPRLGMTAFSVGDEEPAIILSARKDARPALWFVVDDVRQTAAELREKGVTFLSEPFAIRTGMAAEFEDPFGNRLGIADSTAGAAPAAGPSGGEGGNA